ncbi:DNA topoisomerase VI subunit B [Candidatus Mancarchaeum acidiphilum]|nr:DNA topoisomerase VI subunit B [Candidatus Mancarchaeum acidiphilum]
MPPINNANETVGSADSIFNKFKEHSISEFFKKNKQMLGYSGLAHSMVTIVHEYVTNSLDACEEAGILPEITVSIKDAGENKYWISIEDNGPGIPKKYIGKALATILAGTKFNSYKQQRGQQGIGAAGCTLFSSMTTGKPIHIESTTLNESYACDLSINTIDNTPVVSNMSDINHSGTGLKVEGVFGEIKYERGDRGVYEYLKRTALVNPHCQIAFIDPESEKYIFTRSINAIPKKPKEVKPHPLGLSINDIIEFSQVSQEKKISTFLQNSFTRVSPKKIEELRKVCNIDFDKPPSEINWDDAEMLINAFKKIDWIAPDASSLSILGKSQIKTTVLNILNPEYISVTERKPKVFYGGIPFIIESAIAIGGNAGKKTEDNDYTSNIMRFANKVPLLFDAGSCAITEAVKKVSWKRYDIDLEKQPVSIMVNMSSIYIPYSGVGKESIQQDQSIVNEIKFALMDCAREMHHYLKNKERDKIEMSKYKSIIKYVDHLSSDLAFITDMDRGMIKEKLSTLVESHYIKKKDIEETDSGESGEQVI